MPLGSFVALAGLALAQTPAMISAQGTPSALSSSSPSGWEWILESRPASFLRRIDLTASARCAVIAQADGLTVRVLRPDSRAGDGTTASAAPLPGTSIDQAIRVAINFHHPTLLNLRIRQPLTVTMDLETAHPGLGRQMVQFSAGDAPSGPCWTLETEHVSQTAIHVRGTLEVIERRVVEEVIEGRDQNDQPVVTRLSRPVATIRKVEVDRLLNADETLVWSEGDPLEDHGSRRIYLLTLKRVADSPPVPAPASGLAALAASAPGDPKTANSKDPALTRTATADPDETAWRTRVYFVGDLAPPHPRLKRPDGRAVADLNAIADRIRCAVAPETWEPASPHDNSPLGNASPARHANGARGTIQSFHLNESLIVRQTLAVHRRIAAYLDQLRAHSAQSASPALSDPQ